MPPRICRREDVVEEKPGGEGGGVVECTTAVRLKREMVRRARAVIAREANAEERFLERHPPWPASGGEFPHKLLGNFADKYRNIL